MTFAYVLVLVKWVTALNMQLLCHLYEGAFFERGRGKGQGRAPNFLAMHPLGAGEVQKERDLQINWCIANAEGARRIAKRAETELASVLLI
ncbi:MAG TPA: hypothetical protein VI140_01210 [Oxalicibacterium sp.]